MRRWWDGLDRKTVLAIQGPHPDMDLDAIAIWATTRRGYAELFDALAERAAEHFGEPFTWFRWIHRSPSPPDIPSGVLPPARERAYRELQERVERVLPPGIEKEFQRLVVAAVLEPVETSETKTVERDPDHETPRSQTTHPGGARLKEWPRLALEEAARLWVTGAHDGSRNEIARQVTKKVIAEWKPDDFVAHGWVGNKPFKFTPYAMNLVVKAVDDGLLAWDAERGLGVPRTFSATSEWLPIPRRKPAS